MSETWEPLTNQEAQELRKEFCSPEDNCAECKMKIRFVDDRDHWRSLAEQHPHPWPREDWKSYGERVIAWRKVVRRLLEESK